MRLCHSGLPLIGFFLLSSFFTCPKYLVPSSCLRKGGCRGMRQSWMCCILAVDFTALFGSGLGLRFATPKAGRREGPGTTEGLDHDPVHLSDFSWFWLRSAIAMARCTEPISSGHLREPHAGHVCFIVTAIAKKNELGHGVRRQAANHTCRVTHVWSFHWHAAVLRAM